MADHDRAAVRREITDAPIAALDRRHEVLGIAPLGAEAVVAMPLHRLTKDSRRQIAAELEDLNSRLTFTLIERPESTGEHLVLRQFSSESDRDLFEARTADIGAAGDGSGGPAGSLDDEIGSAVGRIDAEDAVWLVLE